MAALLLVYLLLCVGMAALAYKLLTARPTPPPCTLHLAVDPAAAAGKRAACRLPTPKLAPSCAVPGLAQPLRPFAYDFVTPTRARAFVLAALFGLLGLPRAFVMNFAIMSASVVAWLVVRIVGDDPETPPPPSIFRAVGYAYFRLATRLYAAGLGYWNVKVEGEKASVAEVRARVRREGVVVLHPPPCLQAPIIVSNHVSFVETLYLGGVYGYARHLSSSPPPPFYACTVP